MSHNMKKRFGQNFLRDKNLLSAIVKDAGITQEDEVLEIGAGEGALTKELSIVAKKVVSFEIDKDLIEPLQSLGLKNVEFKFQDALKTDIKEIEKLFEGEYKLVANLPYYITTPLLFKFLEESERVTSLTVMVQREVAERIVATKGKDYGILSVMISFYGKAELKRNVGRQMFYPVPNVDSAIVRIDIDRKKYSEVNRYSFAKLVRAAFAMRRKTLYNNLSKLYDKSLLNEKIDASVLTKRAEELNLEDFIDIERKLNK